MHIYELSNTCTSTCLLHGNIKTRYNEIEQNCHPKQQIYIRTPLKRHPLGNGNPLETAIPGNGQPLKRPPLGYGHPLEMATPWKRPSLGNGHPLEKATPWKRLPLGNGHPLKRPPLGNGNPLETVCFPASVNLTCLHVNQVTLFHLGDYRRGVLVDMTRGQGSLVLS